MSDSRMIPLDELNKIIDDKIEDYKDESEKCFKETDVERPGQYEGVKFLAKAEALEDLKIEINDPTPIINVSENLQQTKNVIDSQNIINNDL